MSDYFSDREYGPMPRVSEVIEEPLWNGIRALVELKLDDGSFGHRFPSICPDPGKRPFGCDRDAFAAVLQAELLTLEWPLRRNELPKTVVILDLLEFCARAVGKQELREWHSFFDHYHVSWDHEAGLADFATEINRLFARNGVAFEMSSDGKVSRVLPDCLHALPYARFASGDSETDRLLEYARVKILSPRDAERSDGLEKLWDAFERIKTLEPGGDKKVSASILLDRAARPGSKLRAALDEEAAALTRLGNALRIRHSEMSQEPLESPLQVDFLFARLFAFLHYLLKSSGRAT